MGLEIFDETLFTLMWILLEQPNKNIVTRKPIVNTLVQIVCETLSLLKITTKIISLKYESFFFHDK